MPGETGSGAAVGSPPFTLTLNPDTTPIIIEITDGDANFDENDAGQVLTSDVTLNGVTYTAGTQILGAYNLINSGSGHLVTGFHIDAGATAGGYTGPVLGMMSTEPLIAGTSYTFDVEQSTWSNPVPYANYVACFTRGTPIETPNGPKNVEGLIPGDQILTRDHGVQTLRWIASRTVAAKGDFAPVVFMPGAIGNTSELTVSPQHRMLMGGWQCELLFGEAEVLAPATHLVNGDTIYRREGGDVTYFHLMFDQHEIVFSGGVESESFHPSGPALSSFDHATRTELMSLFPELAQSFQTYGPTARRVLRKYETRLLEAA